MKKRVFCFFLFSFLFCSHDFNGKNEFVVAKKKKVTKRKTKDLAYELVEKKINGCLERAKSLAQGELKELIHEAQEGIAFFSECMNGSDPLGGMKKKELVAFTEKQKKRMKQLQLQV